MGDTSRWPPFYRWEHRDDTWQYDSVYKEFSVVHRAGNVMESTQVAPVPPAIAAEFERLLGEKE